MNIKDRLPALTKKRVSEKALQQTFKYQKLYGFEMGVGEHATHNNEADAFKHAFMQAYTTICAFRGWAIAGGNYHEYIEGKNDPIDERNMDLWNNSIGREVAYDLKKNLGTKYHSYSVDELSDMASDMIIEKMNNGELITNPNDKRKYSKMQYDRLQDKDRVFYKGELYDGMDEEERNRYSGHYIKYQNMMQRDMPSKAELQAKTISGKLIYINNYVRGDGTKVKGYYRRRLIY